MTTEATVNWIAENRPCPICGSSLFRAVGLRGGIAHRSGSGVPTLVVRCTKCDAFYCSPTLIPDKNPYTQQSSDTYFSSVDPASSVETGKKYAAMAEKLLGHTGTMLEVGCGLGYFLSGAAQRNWVTSGVDFTSTFVEQARARGLTVECAAPETSRLLLEGQYDCILALNFLEHVYNPMTVIRLIATALKPGGVLAIGVPNEAGLTAAVGNAYFRARGRQWSMNMSPTFPPFHVVGFTPTALRYALSSVGLSVVSFETVAGVNENPAPSGLLARLEDAAIGTAQKIGARIGRGDAIDCWARKSV